MVIETFNQTAAAATTGKVTIGLVAALWSASVGFASIQDGMNTVYKVRESRPYWMARGQAILVTMLLSVDGDAEPGGVCWRGPVCARGVLAYLASSASASSGAGHSSCAMDSGEFPADAAVQHDLLLCS